MGSMLMRGRRGGGPDPWGIKGNVDKVGAVLLEDGEQDIYKHVLCQRLAASGR
jgi:hypothetical protein